MHVDQRGEGLGSDETKMPAWIPCFICTRPRMAPKLWRESYSAKGMHALIDYHRSDILPSNVERLCTCVPPNTEEDQVIICPWMNCLLNRV